MSSAKRIVVELLGRAGVGIDGTEPCDLDVRDDRFCGRLVANGSLGFAAQLAAPRPVVPHARFVAFERCGHFPNLEDPRRFAALVLGWEDA